MLMQKIEVHENEVLATLRRFEKHGEFSIVNKIYYPYYFFECNVRSKRKLMNGKVGCTIDGLNGKGAIIDVKPEIFTEIHSIHQNFLTTNIDEKQAQSSAEKFIFQTVAEKMKYLAIPNIHFIDRSLFYRPFWIIDFKCTEQHSYPLMMDAISGRYHPL